jgi:hypothetical protein
MSRPQIVEKDRGPKRQRFLGPRVPPSLFAIALGIAGLAQAWDAAVPLLGTPQAIPDALSILDAALWLVLVGAYLVQGPRIIMADLRDPVLSPFVSASALTAMLLSAALAREAFAAGRVLVIAACPTGSCCTCATPTPSKPPGHPRTSATSSARPAPPPTAPAWPGYAPRSKPPPPGQHRPPLRSAEPDPATDTQRAELILTPEHPPGEMSHWITDLTAAYRTFGERLADRQSMTIPAEDPTYGDLGRAFPLWPGPGRGAILQPPERLGSTVGSSRAGVILIS